MIVMIKSGQKIQTVVKISEKPNVIQKPSTKLSKNHLKNVEELLMKIVKMFLMKNVIWLQNKTNV